MAVVAAQEAAKGTVAAEVAVRGYTGGSRSRGDCVRSGTMIDYALMAAIQWCRWQLYNGRVL